ncbi:MAG: hypothetical protein RBS36_10680, partial [Thiomicrospira sp.]|nr:hypothetical protein [Thiomicrospira sp.]
VVKAKQPALIKRIKHIVPALRHAKTDEFVSAALVNQAIQSPALNNPIFLPYRKVLDFAEMLIKLEGLQSNAVSDQSGVSFVLNIAELFEVYIRKLLALHFPDWTVDSPKISLYENQFYSRRIIPDIVMRKGNKVAVFDTKYKRMNYQGTSQRGMGDVDRADFFQIHTYMSYYQSQPDIEFIGGGLIYPLAAGYSETTCFSAKVLENNQAWFCVEGIEIPKQFEQQSLDNTSSKKGSVDAEKKRLDQAAMQELLDSENTFIERIRQRLAH